MAAGGDGAPFTAIRVDDGAPVVDDGDSVSATVIAPGVHTVAFYARDAAGNVNDGADVNGRANAAPSTTTVRIDREPPAVVFAGSADPEDPELIEARVSDALSGPDPSRGQIAVRAAGSDGPYEPLPTVGAGGTLLARWASDDYPVGEYEFRATGYDAAGNAPPRTDARERLADGPAQPAQGAGDPHRRLRRPRSAIAPEHGAVPLRAERDLQRPPQGDLGLPARRQAGHA